jgi:hypothetical protein
MRASILTIVLALCLVVAWSGAAGAQGNPMVGTWTASDPGSGQQEQLVITEETLQFGAGEPQIPYTAEASGDGYALFIGGPDNPATFTLLGPDTAELAIPEGPTIALTRAAAGSAEVAPAAGAPDAGLGDAGSADGQEGQGATGGSLIDELMAAAVPYGVATRYEPLNESLETLLSAGWKIEQAGGASGAFTLLLTNGGSNALCILVPKDLGQADTALSDCRRLN